MGKVKYFSILPWLVPTRRGSVPKPSGQPNTGNLELRPRPRPSQRPLHERSDKFQISSGWGGMWINFGRHGSQCSTKHGSGRIKEANREYEISGLHGALAVI
ncbi:hypothetical protein ACLKA7_002726 [Drosophila subpalustris]